MNKTTPIIEASSELPETISKTEEEIIEVAEPALAVEKIAKSIKFPFSKLELIPELLQAIADLGYTEPTEVQINAIPLAMPEVLNEQVKYQDLMVSSRTGSGKTAAFLLPILNTLIQEQKCNKQAAQQEFEAKVVQALAEGEEAPKKPRRRNPKTIRHSGSAKPQALVLCPTRELAQQVNQDAIGLLKHSRNLRVASIIGGTPYHRQVAALQGASIIIATPGRLLDLQRSNQLQLDEVRFLVLDEADRMLDLGFSDDLNEINKLCKNREQTLMFSATFAPKVQQLASNLMVNPIKIEVTKHQQQHADISQCLYWADNLQHKRDMLDHMLRSPDLEQAIVFASTKLECDDLARDLQQLGFSAQALHGDLNQGLRNRRLSALRAGKIQVLVATDVAARGIDVPSITHVFNYGLPMKAEDYTHRIGRTGRAGRTGTAITFAEFRDRLKIFDIERYNNNAITSMQIEGLEPRQRFPQDGESLKQRSSGGNNSSKSSRSGNGGNRRRSDSSSRDTGSRSFGKRPSSNTSGNSFKRDDNRSTGSSFKRDDNRSTGSSFKRDDNRSAGSSFSRDDNRSAGSSFSRDDNRSAGSSFSRDDNRSAGSPSRTGASRGRNSGARTGSFADAPRSTRSPSNGRGRPSGRSSSTSRSR